MIVVHIGTCIITMEETIRYAIVLVTDRTFIFSLSHSRVALIP